MLQELTVLGVVMSTDKHPVEFTGAPKTEMYRVTTFSKSIGEPGDHVAWVPDLHLAKKLVKALNQQNPPASLIYFDLY
jgi:hypothetical protein